jgi:hypothetical protein
MDLSAADVLTYLVLRSFLFEACSIFVRRLSDEFLIIDQDKHERTVAGGFHLAAVNPLE